MTEVGMTNAHVPSVTGKEKPWQEWGTRDDIINGPDFSGRGRPLQPPNLHDTRVSTLTNGVNDDNSWSLGDGDLVNVTESDIAKNPGLQGLHPGWYAPNTSTSLWYLANDGSAVSPRISVFGEKRPGPKIIREGEPGYSDVNNYGWKKPGDFTWIADSREVPGTGKNIFGELIKGPRKPTMAAKGGDAPDLAGMSNFLATDKVPDTIFGIPVVSRREDYTEADLAFFRDHPEAGGYYDMGEGTPEDGSDEGAPVQADMPLRDLWSRAVKSTGDPDGMARVFAAMSGESSLRQRGSTAEQIINGHLARMLVHANETDRYNGNPENKDTRTVMDTTNRSSHVLSKYDWGTGPGTNWFDTEKMEPRFGLIERSPSAARAARALILNGAKFLNGDLDRSLLPSDAISYGDGPNGLMSDRKEIKAEENKIGLMPEGFRIGRRKGAK